MIWRDGQIRISTVAVLVLLKDKNRLGKIEENHDE
jgi:hypothetical protein